MADSPGLVLSAAKDRRLRRWLVWGYAAAALLTILLAVYRSENNFQIYRSSLAHLLAGQNLYALHPADHADLYRYSPTFALLFAPFAWFPTTLGILLWNLGSLLLLYFALHRLLPDPPGSIALAGALLGFLITQDGTETNLLVAALMVYALVALEGKRLFRSAAAIAVGGMIKVFPLAALAFGAFTCRKARFALLFFAVLLGLMLLPLLLVRPSALLAQYGYWLRGMQQPVLDRWRSVMTMLHQWLGVEWRNWPVQLAGVAIVLAPLAFRARQWGDWRFHRLMLASLLIFVVLFNHQGEFNSTSIALIGTAIWCALPPLAPARLLLALFAILSARVEATLLVWVAVQVDLWRSAGLVDRGILARGLSAWSTMPPRCES